MVWPHSADAVTLSSVYTQLMTFCNMQIGFAVALVCEGVLPRPGSQGVFGQDSPQTLWVLAGCGAAVICTAVVCPRLCLCCTTSCCQHSVRMVA